MSTHSRVTKRSSPTQFRRRSNEISRIEAFSDVVFGFALTLMVVSLEVPHTFGELMLDMRGFVPFAICFALLAQVWWLHHNFFRRYGLDDATTAVLNFVLLFVILFYTYPLKFVFVGIFNQLTGHAEAADALGKTVRWTQPGEAPTLMAIYGLGYAAVFLVFVLLYRNALKNRAELDLNALEVFDTRTSMMEAGFSSAVGILCAVTAQLLPTRMAGWSGFLFFLLPLGMTIIGHRRGDGRRKLEAAVLDSGTDD
jgi:transmembrane protein TMEM174 (potassium channel)